MPNSVCKSVGIKNIWFGKPYGIAPFSAAQHSLFHLPCIIRKTRKISCYHQKFLLLAKRLQSNVNCLSALITIYCYSLTICGIFRYVVSISFLPVYMKRNLWIKMFLTIVDFFFNCNHILLLKALDLCFDLCLELFFFDLCILLIHLWIEKMYTECRYLEPIECRLFVKTSLFIKCRILHVTRVFARWRRFC